MLAIFGVAASNGAEGTGLGEKAMLSATSRCDPLPDRLGAGPRSLVSGERRGYACRGSDSGNLQVRERRPERGFRLSRRMG